MKLPVTVTTGRSAVVFLAALCVGLALGVAPARAQLEVESPEVEEGALEVESVSAVFWGYQDEDEDDDDDDDGDDDDEEEEGEDEEDEAQQRQGHEIAIGYGVTDFWKPTVGIELNQDRDESLEVKSISFENTFEVLSTEEHPVGLGFFAAYEGPIDDDAAHEVVFGPIVMLPIGPVVTTVNPFFERQFGENREEGFGFSYAWQTLVEVTEGVALGFEAFGEIENFADDPPETNMQEHRIGPVIAVEHEISEGIELGVDTGFLFGLTDETSDYAFKFNFEVEIEF